MRWEERNDPPSRCELEEIPAGEISWWWRRTLVEQDYFRIGVIHHEDGSWEPLWTEGPQRHMESGWLMVQKMSVEEQESIREQHPSKCYRSTVGEVS